MWSPSKVSSLSVLLIRSMSGFCPGDEIRLRCLRPGSSVRSRKLHSQVAGLGFGSGETSLPSGRTLPGPMIVPSREVADG